ncbi:Ribokinase-like protein [Mycena albidolilacea]|uniref:Ribokinase n=1 Tax=Mycena albidolilacea TaxID=1033008 RepID=A0AAD7ED81_9AGAR|nr:Ribokinase-like protein [Mycena albidolilacea]
MPARCLVRGSVNVDEFFQVKEIARPGETISAENLVKRPGGKGANQAGALARAGAIVDLVGAVGQDAPWVRDELRETGIGVGDVSIVEEHTGRALIQVNELGENSIILYKGANYASVPPYAIHPDTTHAVFQNEIPLSSTLECIARCASSSQISTIFNPSPMPTAEELKSFPWHQLTWLIVNSGEALDLCRALGLAVPDTSASASAADTARPLLARLSSHMPTTNVVCTLGADGVLAQFTPTLLGGESEPVYLPAAKLQGTTRDTTGAGDCFTGYLVAGLMGLGQKPVATAADYVAVLKRAVQAAGMCVEKRGALASIPLATQVEARLDAIP